MKQGMKFLNVVLCAVLLAGCMADDDLYDPAKAEALLKAQYKENFFKGFGEVPSDYSWDATSSCPKYGTVTRAEGDYELEVGDYYEVPSETLEWLKTELPENKNNQGKGKPFIMTVPGNKFTIIPIYQGNGALDWELHMVVGKEDIKLWDKSQNIQVYRERSWPFSSGWYNLLTGIGSTTWSDRIQGIPLTFDLTDVTRETMYFYLKITKGDFFNLYDPEGTIQSSLEHMMLALECPRPKDIPLEKEVMIVGCEDTKKGSEYDMNDLVFMIVGEPKVPQKIDIQTGELKEIITKRYMMEDLGSTCDRDFNDVVVDVTQERIKHIEIVDGVIDESKTTCSGLTQKAVIRHLGGTLPFRLLIGETDLGEMEGKLGANPDTEHTIDGWIPEDNNVSLKVGTEESSGVISYYTIDFPGEGEAPMIIAVDPDVQWMEERVPITKEWFESIRKN